jgi:hypothetical protein
VLNANADAVHRGDIAGALTTILTDPPYGDGVDEAKVGGTLDAGRFT